jgi:hypothetical protein
MPRANRHFVPGYVWHITHRCHRKSFLLKFARDRRRYLHWVFEAKKRFGLAVLNYVVTSNQDAGVARWGRNSPRTTASACRARASTVAPTLSESPLDA